MEDYLVEEAYLLSAEEYDLLKKKFPAFASAFVSDKAKAQGAYVDSDYEGKGHYPLRTAADPYSLIFFGHSSGMRVFYSSSSNSAGLRVALQVIYNPECDVVKSCKNEKRTTLVCNENNGQDENVTSEAPIVIFGKIKYIWLNKEECEAGTAKTMQLVSLDLLERAVPLDINGFHNDYALAEALRGQVNRIAKENCTKEELDMIVPVAMSKEDGYAKATPITELNENLEIASNRNKDGEGLGDK